MRKEQMELIQKVSESKTGHFADNDFVRKNVAQIWFELGMEEVFENPEKYGFMSTPSEDEIEKYCQDDPFSTLKEAFEHFKNIGDE